MFQIALDDWVIVTIHIYANWKFCIVYKIYHNIVILAAIVDAARYLLVKFVIHYVSKDAYRL